MIKFVVGDHVRIKHDINDAPSGDSPGCLCARAGDLLRVAKVNDDGVIYPLYVAHFGVKDKSFGVYPYEIYKDINSNLKHKRIK